MTHISLMRIVFILLLAVALWFFTTMLARADVRILGSPGGQVGPFIDLFDQVRASGERVVIDGPCLSACTLAFAAGGQRILRKGAVLGFHRGAFPGSQSDDVGSGVEREIYATAGFSKAFIDRALATATLLAVQEPFSALAARRLHSLDFLGFTQVALLISIPLLLVRPNARRDFLAILSGSRHWPRLLALLAIGCAGLLLYDIALSSAHPIIAAAVLSQLKSGRTFAPRRVRYG